MTVRIPPDGLVDIDVLNKEGHQQVDEEEKLEEKAAIQWQLRDPAVTHRFWGDQGCDWRSRKADGTTIPEKETHH